jgi:hypothetical protein
LTECCAQENWQGLKPNHFIGFIGMTEVMPCFKAFSGEFFRKL